MTIDQTYTLAEVLRRGFEARCVGPDGCRYLWHGAFGLRVEPRSGRTTLLRDPAALPEEMWVPTRFGLKVLEEMESADRSPGTPA